MLEAESERRALPRPWRERLENPYAFKDPYTFDHLLIASARELSIVECLQEKFADFMLPLRGEVLKKNTGRVIYLATHADTEALADLINGKHTEEKRGLLRIDTRNPLWEEELPRFFLTALALKLRRNRDKDMDIFTEREEEMFHRYRREEVVGVRADELRERIKGLLSRFSSEVAAAFD